MAESTRSKSNLEHLEEAMAKLASNHLYINEKLDALILRIENLENKVHHAHTPSSSSATPTPSTTISNPPRMKLDVPRFDGSNLSGWVFKITQFFEYHSTP